MVPDKFFAEHHRYQYNIPLSYANIKHLVSRGMLTRCYFSEAGLF